MWMLECPLYTTCEYFKDWARIVHFRAKHRILDFCKQTLNEQQCLMCNKGNTHKNFVNCKILILFHTCNLVHSLSVGILQFYINQSMCSHFRKFFLLRVCLRQQENALLQKGIWLVAWSQSVRMPHQRPYWWWILSAIVRSKSTRIFIPKTIVICNTSMISANVRVLLKEMSSSCY